MIIFCIAIILLIIIFLIIPVINSSKHNKSLDLLIEHYKNNAENDNIKSSSPENISNDFLECIEILDCIILNNFTNLHYKINKVLSVNPKNKIATAIINSDISFNNILNGEFTLMELNPLAIQDYIFENTSELNHKILTAFTMLLYYNSVNSVESSSCMKLILTHFEKCFSKKSHFLSEFKILLNYLKNHPYMTAINDSLRQTKGSGLKTFLYTDNEYLAAMMDEMRDTIKEYKQQLTTSYKIILNEIENFIPQISFLTDEDKTTLLKYFKSNIK